MPKAPLCLPGDFAKPLRTESLSCNLTLPEILGFALGVQLGRNGNGSCHSQVLAVI